MSGAAAGPAREVSAIDCAVQAWHLLWKAPGVHLLAGFLLLFWNEILPSLGDVLPLPFISEILLATGSLLTGIFWIGMASMSLTELSGGTATVEELFAPFRDARRTPALIYGGLIALMMVVASLAAKSFMPSFDVKDLKQMQMSSLVQMLDPGSLTIGLFIYLLPLVAVTCYFFPAGFYIAQGEKDCFAALRKGGAVMASRPWFWTAFWVVITVGDVLGMLSCLCTCFIGMSFAFVWTCLAMGAAIVAIDPSFIPSAEPPKFPGVSG